ncbi:MAG: hypothetical protein JWQ54_173 [Mucilaginibacter sp.]|nr:hypothetical protein [Mucilaginibacter sp.]
MINIVPLFNYCDFELKLIIKRKLFVPANFIEDPAMYSTFWHEYDGPPMRNGY